MAVLKAVRYTFLERSARRFADGRSKGAIMDWARILAYVTGTVDATVRSDHACRSPPGCQEDRSADSIVKPVRFPARARHPCINRHGPASAGVAVMVARVGNGFRHRRPTSAPRWQARRAFGGRFQPWLWPSAAEDGGLQARLYRACLPSLLGHRGRRLATIGDDRLVGAGEAETRQQQGENHDGAERRQHGPDRSNF
jgi:hypothetical protein